MAFIDFTNPNACKWYQAKLAELIDLGVDAFKVLTGFPGAESLSSLLTVEGNHI